MKIVLVHGFNVSDKGARTVDRLAPFFPPHWKVEKDEADYGLFGLWKVRFRKHSAVRRIAGALATADGVVTHSNGANYTMKALKFVTGSGIKVFHLSPAVNRTEKFPKAVEKAIVFFTRTDFWVFLSGFLPFHPWGWMGYLGAKTEDPRIENRDFSDIVSGHSDWFSEENAEFIAGIITLEMEKWDDG